MGSEEDIWGLLGPEGGGCGVVLLQKAPAQPLAHCLGPAVLGAGAGCGLPALDKASSGSDPPLH